MFLLGGGGEGRFQQVFLSFFFHPKHILPSKTYFMCLIVRDIYFPLVPKNILEGFHNRSGSHLVTMKTFITVKLLSPHKSVNGVMFSATSWNHVKKYPVRVYINQQPIFAKPTYCQSVATNFSEFFFERKLKSNIGKLSVSCHNFLTHLFYKTGTSYLSN